MKRSLIVLGLLATFAGGAFAGQQVVSRYSQVNWHCSNWENEWKITPGGHSAIVMFAELPATPNSDRRVCYATLKSDEPNFQVLSTQ